ncbi:hypothetical protein H0W26_00815 [Candidatus Dependentiae bacterium]|nr:hypothetical protein [Candidatus Dependentiae bacterium]
MDTNAYLRFVEYAELEQKIERLTQERFDLVKKMEQIAAKSAALVNENQETCRIAHSLRKEMDFVELELRTLGQKLLYTEKLLQSTMNVKEYSALQHEVESLKASRSSLEESGLTLLDKWEEAQGVCERAQAAEPAHLEALTEQMQELSERSVYVDSLKSAYVTQRDTKKNSIDPELLEFYTSMKEKASNPVVPLINGQCSACFYSAPPKDVNDIVRGSVVRCKNCYRFLYTHQPVKKDDT